MLKMRQHSLQQQGFTLVEMMISVVLSMIVVLGSINLYISIIGSGKNINERNRLTEELRQ